MNRRGFLKSMLAAGVAPYVVTSAGVLMPVRKIIGATPEETFAFTQSGSGATARTVQDALRLWGDGIHDDTAALQAWLDGKPVVDIFGLPVGGVLSGGRYRVSKTVYIGPHQPDRLITGNIFEGQVKTGPMFHITPPPEDVPFTRLRDVYFKTS
jgi:hypothetical protein